MSSKDVVSFEIEVDSNQDIKKVEEIFNSSNIIEPYQK